MTRRRAAVRGVTIEARAKLNLGLAVGPRRRDGYHEVATIYQSVSLADTLVVRPRPAGFTLRVRHEDAARRGGHARAAAGVPRGSGNLVLRAARLLARRLGLPGGARFDLVKRIPAGTGLGGGSADAAAALAGLAALHRIRLLPALRQELAAALGADVPFATLGGTALGLGRGERLRRLRLRRPLRVVIAVPRWRISTRRAFDQIDRSKYGLTAWGAKLRFAQSLGRKSLSAVTALRLGNAFESVLGRWRSDFASLRTRLMRAGARNVQMTGSGSAVFGLLAPGTRLSSVTGAFVGEETLYIAHSMRRAMRLRRF